MTAGLLGLAAVGTLVVMEPLTTASDDTEDDATIDGTTSDQDDMFTLTIDDPQEISDVDVLTVIPFGGETDPLILAGSDIDELLVGGRGEDQIGGYGGDEQLNVAAGTMC